MPTESDYKIVGGPGATLDDNLKAAVGKLNVVKKFARTHTNAKGRGNQTGRAWSRIHSSF